MSRTESVKSRQQALETRFGPWQPRTLDQLLDHPAQRHPDRELVITDERSFTYSEIAQWAGRVAGHTRHLEAISQRILSDMRPGAVDLKTQPRDSLKPEWGARVAMVHPRWQAPQFGLPAAGFRHLQCSAGRVWIRLFSTCYINIDVGRIALIYTRNSACRHGRTACSRRQPRGRGAPDGMPFATVLLIAGRDGSIS